MTPEPDPRLIPLIRAELAVPVDPAVATIAEAARAAHGPAVAAVLFYGSCLRDGYRTGLMVDLYVLIDDYSSVHRSRLMRWLNRLIPPNVYYLEVPDGQATMRAKYALVALAQFERRMGPDVGNPYFWARFAQPCGLVWARDEIVRERMAAALAEAIQTTAAAARPLVGAGADAATLWTRALAESYRTELRAEKPHRTRTIIEQGLDRWQRVTALLPTAPATTEGEARRRWRSRRVEGKALSVLRLVKAAFTFAGGGDYLAWKINRHAGVPVEFSPWQRRHPLLAAPFVLWRLARRGVVR